VGIQSKGITSKNNYIENNENGKSLAIDYGTGPELLVGYSINEEIDVIVGGGMSWVFTSSSSYTVSNINVSGRYYFPEVFIKPYAGLGIGYYQKTFKATTITDSLTNTEIEYIIDPERGIGVSPSVGILFNPKMSRHFWINAEVSYSNIFSKLPYHLIDFKVGLFYYF